MSQKKPGYEMLLNELAEASFGRKRTSTQCVKCGSDKVKSADFKDDLSRKEFGISRFCQKCQDEIYGGSE